MYIYIHIYITSLSLSGCGVCQIIHLLEHRHRRGRLLLNARARVRHRVHGALGLGHDGEPTHALREHSLRKGHVPR